MYVILYEHQQVHVKHILFVVSRNEVLSLPICTTLNNSNTCEVVGKQG